jgi:hypothetical protein
MFIGSSIIYSSKLPQSVRYTYQKILGIMRMFSNHFKYILRKTIPTCGCRRKITLKYFKNFHFFCFTSVKAIKSKVPFIHFPTNVPNCFQIFYFILHSILGLFWTKTHFVSLLLIFFPFFVNLWI